MNAIGDKQQEVPEFAQALGVRLDHEVNAPVRIGTAAPVREMDLSETP